MTGTRIADSRTASVVGIDRDSRVTLWTRGAEVLYNIPARDAIGRELRQLLEWNAFDEDAEIHRLFRVGDVWVFKDRVRTRSGIDRLLKTTVTLAVDAEGAEEFLIAAAPADADVLPDVARARRTGSVTGPSDVLSYCDAAMVLESTGSSIGRLYGYLQRDVIGHTFSDWVHPDDQLTWQRAWDKALATPGEVVTVEVRRVGADGRWHLMATELSNLLDAPAVQAVVVSSRDITEQHELGALLSASEQTLRAVLEGSLEGVWIVDQKGATAFANGRMAELLDVSQSELAQSRVGEVLGGLLARYIRVLPVGARDQHEFPVIGSGGLVRWLRLAVVARFDHRGRHSGSILMCADVTHERRSQQRRQLADVFRVATTDPQPTPADADARAGVSEPDAPTGHGSTRALPRKLTVRETEIVSRLVSGDRVASIAKRALCAALSTDCLRQLRVDHPRTWVEP
jgi:PAS domain S-box-containing protein